MAEYGNDVPEAVLEKYGRDMERFGHEGGYTFHARVDAVLQGLGFDAEESKTRLVSTLSGGERGRVGLAAQLIAPADLLMLDARLSLAPSRLAPVALVIMAGVLAAASTQLLPIHVAAIDLINPDTQDILLPALAIGVPASANVGIASIVTGEPVGTATTRGTSVSMPSGTRAINSTRWVRMAATTPASADGMPKARPSVVHMPGRASTRRWFSQTSSRGGSADIVSASSAVRCRRSPSAARARGARIPWP